MGVEHQKEDVYSFLFVFMEFFVQGYLSFYKEKNIYNILLIYVKIIRFFFIDPIQKKIFSFIFYCFL